MLYGVNVESRKESRRTTELDAAVRPLINGLCSTMSAVSQFIAAASDSDDEYLDIEGFSSDEEPEVDEPSAAGGGFPRRSNHGIHVKMRFYKLTFLFLSRFNVFKSFF